MLTGYEDWSFWWARHKDAVLTRAIAGRARPDQDEVRRWVVPALRRLLRDPELNFDIASAAAIALARIGDAASAPLLCEIATGASETRRHKVVLETAALALGVLDDNATVSSDTLRTLLLDQSANSSFVRPFAALALALRERGSPTDATLDALQLALRQEERKPEVHSAGLLALGLLDDGRAAGLLRGVADGSGLGEGGREIGWNEQPAAVAALGSTGPAAGPDVIEALIAIANGEPERRVRREAVLALGRIAGRCADSAAATVALDQLIAWFETPGPAFQPEHVVQGIGRVGATHAESVRRRVMTFLGGVVETDERAPVRSNAAVALGLAVYRLPPTERGSARVIRDRFRETEEPWERAAYAVALGLLGDHEAVASLRAVLDDGEQAAVLRAYCMVSLGLLGAREAVPAILAAKEAEGRSIVHTQGNLALGLLGGAAAREHLLDWLRPGTDKDHWGALGAAAWGLGAAGDIETLPVLVASAEDRTDEAADFTRALAVTALGLLCEREGAPSLDPLREAVPYRLWSQSLGEFLTLL